MLTYDDVRGLVLSAVGGGCVGYVIGATIHAWQHRTYHMVKGEDGRWYSVRGRR